MFDPCRRFAPPQVIAFDPYLSDERAVTLGVEKVELDELFRRADFITLHVPLTPETRGVICTANISKMKPGVRIVNCARGELVNEADLKAALDSGHVAGAALDVFSEEPAKTNILFGNDKVICTPHLGASSVEAQYNVAYQVAEQLSDFLIDGAVVNSLNSPSVSAEDAPRLKPFMKLCEQLGSFTAQIMESKETLSAVEITFEGNVAQLNTRPLTSVALAGLLSGVLESVNMVNAPVILRERNIQVSETKREMAGLYPSLVKVSATFAMGTEHVTRSVAGTVFGEGKFQRIVEVDGIPIEAELGKRMIWIRNRGCFLQSLLFCYRCLILCLWFKRTNRVSSDALLRSSETRTSTSLLSTLAVSRKVVWLWRSPQSTRTSPLRSWQRSRQQMVSSRSTL